MVEDTTNSNVARLAVDSSGKVHVGLTNGAGQFNVKNSDDANVNALEIYNDNGVRNASFSQNSAGDAVMDLRTNAASQTVLLRSNGASYLNGGNVGIGTTSPSTALHINTGAAGLPKLRLQHSGTGNDVFEITSGLTGVSNGGFGIYDVDESAYRLVINSSGQVGIGNNTPSFPLEVKAASNAYITTERTTKAGGQVGIQIKGASGGKDWYLYQHTNDDALKIYNTTDGNLVSFTDTGLNFLQAGDGIGFSNQTPNGPSPSSSLLDDYEEGTFTPSYTVGSGGGNMVNNATYNQVGGAYTKVGRLVHFTLRLQLNSGFTVIGGHVVINGLPFTVGASGVNGGQSGATFGYRSALGTNNVELYIPSGGTQIQFYTDDGQTYYAGAGGNNFANTLHVWGTYHAV
tara:strand:- start:20 stop:1225 length:1206 start_codon:yes stop_codon:yes gene_type:complete